MFGLILGLAVQEFMREFLEAPAPATEDELKQALRRLRQRVMATLIVRDLGGQAGFAAFVEDAYQIPVFDATCGGIKRVDPHFLAGCGLQVFHIAVGRMGAGLVVEAEKLERELLAQGIVPAFEGAGIDR